MVKGVQFLDRYGLNQRDFQKTIATIEKQAAAQTNSSSSSSSSSTNNGISVKERLEQQERMADLSDLAEVDRITSPTIAPYHLSPGSGGRSRESSSPIPDISLGGSESSRGGASDSRMNSLEREAWQRGHLEGIFGGEATSRIAQSNGNVRMAIEQMMMEEAIRLSLGGGSSGGSSGGSGGGGGGGESGRTVPKECTCPPQTKTPRIRHTPRCPLARKCTCPPMPFPHIGATSRIIRCTHAPPCPHARYGEGEGKDDDSGGEDELDDPDLAEAIRASLAEAEQQQEVEQEEEEEAQDFFNSIDDSVDPDEFDFLFDDEVDDEVKQNVLDLDHVHIELLAHFEHKEEEEQEEEEQEEEEVEEEVQEEEVQEEEVQEEEKDEEEEEEEEVQEEEKEEEEEVEDEKEVEDEEQEEEEVKDEEEEGEQVAELHVEEEQVEEYAQQEVAAQGRHGEPEREWHGYEKDML